MTLKLHPEADAELQAAAQWYERRAAGLGERFLSEAIDAFAEIEKHPRQFGRARYRTKREIRRKMLSHFPFAVIYEVQEAQCVALAVAHAARKPGYWRARLT